MKLIDFYMEKLGLDYEATKCDVDYPKYSNLSSTIMLMNVSGRSFDEVFQHQLKLSGELKCLPNDHEKIIKPILKSYGFKKIKKIKERSIGEFLFNHKEGEFVVASKKHIEYYKDGIRYIQPLDEKTRLDLDEWLLSSILLVYRKEESDAEQQEE